MKGVKIVSVFQQLFSSLLSKSRIWIATSTLKSNLQIFFRCFFVFFKHQADLLTSQKAVIYYPDYLFRLIPGTPYTFFCTVIDDCWIQFGPYPSTKYSLY